MVERSERLITVTHVTIRQSISLLVVKLIILDILTAFFMLAFCVPIRCFHIPLDFDFYLFVVMVVLKIFFSFFVVFQWLNNYYEITPETISSYHGFIFQKKEKFYIKHIREVGLQQGLFGKLLDFGTIELYNWDLRRYRYLYLIHNPAKYLRIIKELRPNVDQEDLVLRNHYPE